MNVRISNEFKYFGILVFDDHDMAERFPRLETIEHDRIVRAPGSDISSAIYKNIKIKLGLTNLDVLKTALKDHNVYFLNKKTDKKICLDVLGGHLNYGKNICMYVCMYYDITYALVLNSFVGEFMQMQEGARKSLYRETVEELDLTGCEMPPYSPLDFSQVELEAKFWKGDKSIIIKFCRTDEDKIFGSEVLPPYIVKVSLPL